MSSGDSLVQETADSIDEVSRSQVPDRLPSKFLVFSTKSILSQEATRPSELGPNSGS
jgi:hypothetical protein